MNTRPPDHQCCIQCLIAAVLLLAAACSPVSEAAEETSVPDSFPASAVPYPADYRASFVRYLTVDRPDATVRDLYINPEAVDALRQGQPLPDNTIIVIEAYDAEVNVNGDPISNAEGRYIKAAPFEMLHIAHRRSDWAEDDFPSVVRTGRWNFGSFDAATGAPFDEDPAACFNCHQAMPQTDFLYTAGHLLHYVRTGEPQYTFCNLRRRLPC